MSSSSKIMNARIVVSGTHIPKQYYQSIFRHILDNNHIPSRMLKEFDTRHNILIKHMIGLKKSTHITPLNEALKLESVSQIYYKQIIHRTYLVCHI